MRGIGQQGGNSAQALASRVGVGMGGGDCGAGADAGTEATGPGARFGSRNGGRRSDERSRCLSTRGSWAEPSATCGDRAAATNAARRAAAARRSAPRSPGAGPARADGAPTTVPVPDPAGESGRRTTSVATAALSRHADARQAAVDVRRARAERRDVRACRARTRRAVPSRTAAGRRPAGSRPAARLAKNSSRGAASAFTSLHPATSGCETRTHGSARS